MSLSGESSVPHQESPDMTPIWDFIDRIRQRIATVVVGQDVVVERLLISLFTGGHTLLQGVPGLAKTLLVSALAKSIHLEFSRIQFTVDLLPSDIVGSEILDQKSNDFRVHKGPIFTNLLLADEINRAAPKVQSALLEAMQEHKVTIGNETFKLPAPFLVIATQNPVEQAGTFELPEAQLDRFMLCHRLQYPTPAEEREVLIRNARLGIRREGEGAVARTEFDVLEQEAVGSAEDLIAAMNAVQQVYVSETFTDHVIDIVHRTRLDSRLDFGCSPRAGIALIKAARARAIIHRRHYVIPEDLYALAEDIILHRIRLNYEALADGQTGPQILQQIMTEAGGNPITNGKPAMA
ncbi:AAA family ATPase [Rubinisphaera italica]|uniref:Holliday junction ATP-dependent DNA helicase RuvB n=1 Tax=Rubinisphaera italica TaxID=2527969 RepID=A0A5C5XF01_9PLAN|nr:AAA family ATPase [Rubinisphaera italica]TWT60472.1 Holliday junction ATP-dependent DNA helicase RuvB [Rubinisphaera italica]